MSIIFKGKNIQTSIVKIIIIPVTTNGDKILKKNE